MPTFERPVPEIDIDALELGIGGRWTMPAKPDVAEWQKVLRAAAARPIVVVPPGSRDDDDDEITETHCRYCGKELSEAARIRGGKYCGHKCQHAQWRKTGAERRAAQTRVCVVCGKAFHRKKRIGMAVWDEIKTCGAKACQSELKRQFKVGWWEEHNAAKTARRTDVA